MDSQVGSRSRFAARERHRRRTLGLSILVVVGTGFLIALVHRNPLPPARAQGFETAVLEPTGSTDIPVGVPVLSPGGTLRIIWRPGDEAPATHAGVLCVTADGPGHVCVSYAVGERPAELLTREIERRGYHVKGLD
jgi:hypothetical protein